MSGLVVNNISINNDVYRSAVVNILGNDGFCIFLISPTLLGDVCISIFGSAIPNPDKNNPEHWATIRSQDLLISQEAFLFNVITPLYTSIYVKIDGTTEQTGSFSNGYLRILTT